MSIRLMKSKLTTTAAGGYPPPAGDDAVIGIILIPIDTDGPAASADSARHGQPRQHHFIIIIDITCFVINYQLEC